MRLLEAKAHVGMVDNVQIYRLDLDSEIHSTLCRGLHTLIMRGIVREDA